MLTVHQLLTGATGVVGVHILHHLLQNDTISKIYCLIRASDDAQALTRIHDTLHKHRLLKGQDSHLHQLLTQKLSAFSCDFNNVEENLSLQPETLHLFRSTITHIIHNAWSVNFNQSLRSFDRGCISSTHFLLNLAATSPTRLLLPPNNNNKKQKQKPSLTFISSIATALAAPASVAEDLVPWSHVEERMGYAQSKWVAEQLLASAATKAEIPVRIARLGQVCGDSVEGLWNPAEAIPTIVRTAVTQGVLPGEEEELQWLPADVAGEAIVDVAVFENDEDDDGDGEKSRLLQVFNLVNSTFPLFWNRDFLPFLRRAGLSFEIISGRDWVKKLEKYSSIQDEPAVKLFDFFKHKYHASTSTTTTTTKSQSQSQSQGKEEEKERKKENHPRFETARAKKISSAMAKKNCVIDEFLVAKFVRYWREECWI